jgi:hypothetical protein
MGSNVSGRKSRRCFCSNSARICITVVRIALYHIFGGTVAHI